VGLKFSRERARQLRDDAVAALAPLGSRAAMLTELAHFVVSRVT
jgi:geranylgeranyl pyrophosphate synthase